MTTQDDRKLADVRPMAQRITEWDLITQGHIPTAMSKHIATALLAALDRLDELESSELAHLRTLDFMISEATKNIGTQED